jgi:hypothetical protein
MNNILILILFRHLKIEFRLRILLLNNKLNNLLYICGTY